MTIANTPYLAYPQEAVAAALQAVAGAQQSVAAAEADVSTAKSDVASAKAELNQWKTKNPEVYVGIGYDVLTAALKDREAALKDREAALATSQAALKDREAALATSQVALKEREAAFEKVMVAGTNSSNIPTETQIFNSTSSISMTPRGLCDWLEGSPTTSSMSLLETQVVSQQDVSPDAPIQFPLAGREESLKHIANCFVRVYNNRHNDDRNTRPIPICTGVPGLGKTRLLKECHSTVLDLAGISGRRLSAIISYGNDGNPFGLVDERLGVKCSCEIPHESR
ncbi:hypothetical protein HDU76_012233 [Blyttiomyces sp. JEL0837]|nr:hypothetical protein HDU76_012233 [Blyttiomyces sp. JEL0837]